MPRLGSYLAVKLEYDSCLSEEAFDAAVVDFQEVEAKRAEQDKERRDFEDAQAQKRQEFEENEENAGAEFVPEEKTWDEIGFQPFKTEKVQYVVCLDTMGQDRRYSEEEKLQALRTVQSFRDRWEVVEKTNLEGDVRKKLERAEYDKAYKETYEALDTTEVERIAEDEVANRSQPIEGEEPPTEAEKHMIWLKSRFV